MVIKNIIITFASKIAKIIKQIIIFILNMKKQSKKSIKPLIPNPGGNYFAFGTTGQPMQFSKLEAPA